MAVSARARRRLLMWCAAVMAVGGLVIVLDLSGNAATSSAIARPEPVAQDAAAPAAAASDPAVPSTPTTPAARRQTGQKGAGTGDNLSLLFVAIVLVLGAAGLSVFGSARRRARSRTRVDGVLEGVKVERRLVTYLRPHWLGVIAALGITFGSVVVGLAKPWPTKILVDDVLGQQRLGSLSPNAALAVSVVLTLILFLVSGALGILQTRVVYGLAQRLLEDMRGQLFEHLARLSLRYHDERGIGDSTYRVTTDTYAVQSILLNGLLPTVAALLTLVGTFLIMVKLDTELAFVSLVSAPVAVIVTKRYGSRIRRFSLDYSQRESDVYSHAEQSMAGIRTVQAFAREEYETERFRGRVRASRTAMMRLVTLQTVFGLIISGILAAGMALVTWLAARRALAGDLSTGEVLVFLAYAGALYGPISGLTSVFADLQKAAAGAQRVFEVLDLPQPPDVEDTAGLPARADGNVEMKGVGFSYVSGQDVLSGIDLAARPGQLIALVGPTGAGKSTLASLLLRLYDPDEGSITLDGRDLRELPLRWLREQIAFVPQEPLLFPMSVRENIRYGRLEATDAEVEQAARDANILHELMADPRGLDAPLGERGVTLSGGQRQRVALARAFLRDAPVVLLDEPTSALDAGTEVLIMDALERLAAGRTCIVIAHRLATVHRAHRVLVLESGRLAQVGTHRQLIRRRGRYRELHEARFGRESGAAPIAVASLKSAR